MEEKRRGQKREGEIRSKGDDNYNDSVKDFISCTPTVLEKNLEMMSEVKIDFLCVDMCACVCECVYTYLHFIVLEVPVLKAESRKLLSPE